MADQVFRGALKDFLGKSRNGHIIAQSSFHRSEIPTCRRPSQAPVRGLARVISARTILFSPPPKLRHSLSDRRQRQEPSMSSILESFFLMFTAILITTDCQNCTDEHPSHVMTSGRLRGRASSEAQPTSAVLEKHRAERAAAAMPLGSRARRREPTRADARTAWGTGSGAARSSSEGRRPSAERRSHRCREQAGQREEPEHRSPNPSLGNRMIEIFVE
jgi:hypothetical protein